MTYEIQTEVPLFGPFWEGERRFAIAHDNLPFETNDFVYLREYDSSTQRYSGRVVFSRIGHILRDCPGLAPGHCALSLIGLNHYRSIV